MSYGLKYQTQFTSQSDTIAGEPEKDFTLKFSEKNYTGGSTSVPGGDITVKQKCTVEDPLAPIKGQSLDIQLFNLGNIPISSFFSEDDDGILVELIDDLGATRFIGYLVQDDFYEGMVDYGHPITLSANDSLGLLKGVPYNEAPVYFDLLYTSPVEPVTTTAPNVIETNAGFGSTVIVGDKIRINTSAVAGEYTVLTITPGITYSFTVLEPIASQGLTNVSLSILRINTDFRINILSILRRCLGVTNLSLITNIFYNLYEYRQDNTISTFEQTIVDTQLFISGETYENCYEVLTKILTAFECSLFQANGQWNIINWHEAKRYSGNAIPGFVYDESMIFIGNTVLNNNFYIGPDPQLTRPLFELTQGSFRGYKFTRKTFNYVFPKYLLKNYDLLSLGDLISQYVVGTNTISEYVATDWLAGGTTGYVTRFIRVTRDTSTGVETYVRQLVVKGDPLQLSYSKSVRSMPIEVNAGDKIKVSFSVRGVNSSVSWTLEYAMMLTDGTIQRYIDDLPAGNGDWIPTIGFEVPAAGANSNEWKDVEIQSSQIPFNGIFYVYLTEFYGNGDETLYKDIRFEYTVNINDSTKIIGQIHKQNQLVNKKNNSDVEIFIDDTPRNPIAGTLFLTSFNGLLEDRTLYWRYPFDANGWRLGELTTLDELTWRQKTRSKLEGGFIGMFQSNYVSLLTPFLTDFNPSRTYIPGLMTIDYKRNEFTSTLHELYDTQDPAFDPAYSFTYIYSTT